MSTLITSNISDGTTSVGTGYVVNGSAKHWANFYGGGATAALRQTFNVSSLTDIGVGQYSLSFTNSYSAAGWAALAAGEWDNSNGLGGAGTNFTSSVNLVSGVFYPLAVTDDPHFISAGFGDLA